MYFFKIAIFICKSTKAVAVEEADVGLYVLRGEGLIGAVALVEAVQPLLHGSALPFSSTAY